MLLGKITSQVAGSMVKNPPVKHTWAQSLGQEGPLEKETATHSSILAWEIPWTEEPGGLQSMGWQGGGHDLATKQQKYMNRLNLNTIKFNSPSFKV